MEILDALYCRLEIYNMEGKGMKRNRLFALILASTMLWSTVGAKDIQAAESENKSLLAEFTFDNEENGFSGGKAKAERNYTLVESYDSNAGNALHLDGTNQQWLKVTDLEGNSLLTGVDEMTVSYDIKNERDKTNWAFYAAQRAGSWEAGKEYYIGFLHNGGRLSVERYNNPAVMKDDGTVTRGDEDQTVTMTATLKSGDVVVTKEFTIVVKAKNPDEDVVTYTKELTLN